MNAAINLVQKYPTESDAHFHKIIYNQEQEINSLKREKANAERRAREAEFQCDLAERNLLRLQMEPDLKMIIHARDMLAALSKNKNLIAHAVAKTFYQEIAEKLDAINEELTHWIGD